MKKMVLMMCCCSGLMFAQYTGGGLGYSSNRTIVVEMLVDFELFSFSIGLSGQKTGTTGKLLERQPNAGVKYSGSGYYYETRDFSLGILVYPPLKVNVVLSYATKHYYLNFVDPDYEGGIYHMIYKDKSHIAIGFNFGYKIKGLEFYAGCHTVREFEAGIRLAIIPLNEEDE